MTEKMKVTPKDFFLWLTAMGALYFSVGSFIALSFEYIEKLVGIGSVVGYDPYSGGIRFAIASLVVLFPVYIALTRMLNQDIRRNPEKKDLWVRRWVVFLTIFASGVALIVDLIVLINAFLGGEELTAAFLLKVLTVFIVFSGVFYYYLQDIRGAWEKNERASKMIGIGVSLALLLAIASGFFIMGSPQTQRLLRYDQQRIEDLRSIQSQVTDYYRTAEKLPESLATLQDPLAGGYIQNDPETGASYEYNVLAPLRFELCATFNLPLPEFEVGSTIDRNDWRVRDAQQTATEWPHGAGRTCFERTIDPERITPYKGEVPIRF